MTHQLWKGITRERSRFRCSNLGFSKTRSNSKLVRCVLRPPYSNTISRCARQRLEYFETAFSEKICFLSEWKDNIVYYSYRRYTLWGFADLWLSITWEIGRKHIVERPRDVNSLWVTSNAYYKHPVRYCLWTVADLEVRQTTA